MACHRSLALFLTLACTAPSLAQSPTEQWHRGHGTDREEHVHEGLQTSDGGFIAVGHAHEGFGPPLNMLVVKVDAQGDLEWQQSLGTTGQHDLAICVAEVSDGYLVGGGLHATTQQRALVKFDFSGGVVWQKTYAGSRHGAIRGIAVGPQGKIYVTGYQDSAQRGFLFIADEAQGCLMKLEPNGDLLWDKPINAPQGTKVRRVPGNGDLLIASTAWVFDGQDHQQVRLIRTDASGNELWSQDYGGSDHDQCFDFVLTSDGGSILAGHTRSFGTCNWDYYLLKVASDGTEEWFRTFGQPRGYDGQFIHDECYGVRETSDGGFLLAGGSGDESAYSASGHPAGTSNEWKAYLVRTDAQGHALWEGLYGDPGQGHNAAEYVGLTNDGGFIVFTDTDSQAPPQPNNFGFLKLGADPAIDQGPREKPVNPKQPWR